MLAFAEIMWYHPGMKRLNINLKRVLNKKAILVAVPILIVGTSAGAFALTRDIAPKEQKFITKKEEPKDEKQEAVSTETKQPEQKPQPTSTKTQSVSTPTPQPEPQPIYGESSTGVFVVFDKEAVMDQAGINPGSRAVVSQLIQATSGWTYKSPHVKTLCGQHIFLSRVPVEPGWPDNPVQQLKWCNTYVVSHKYGSWEKAKEFFDQQGYF